MNKRDLRTVGFLAAVVGLYRLIRGRWFKEKK